MVCLTLLHPTANRNIIYFLGGGVGWGGELISGSSWLENIYQFNLLKVLSAENILTIRLMIIFLVSIMVTVTFPLNFYI